MSRFSRAEAEARGWRIFHEQPEVTITTSETQGETRTIAGSYRAEKYLSLPGQGTSLITEEADSIGLLLERINAYEAELEKKSVDTTPTTPDLSAAPVDEAGIPQRTVLVPTEPTDLSQPASTTAVTEAEWAARARNDAIFDGEKMIFTGATEESANADNAALESKRAVEDRRASEPAPDTEQIIVDTTQTAIDGAGAQGTYLVHKDEKAEDVAGRLSAEAEKRENDRANTDTTAPEGQEKLAGIDVGMADRGDLGTEIPGQGDTADADVVTHPANEGSEKARGVVEVVEPTSEDTTRSDAIEEAAKATRDDPGVADPDATAERRADIQAGADAEQKAAEDAGAPEDEQTVDDEERAAEIDALQHRLTELQSEE